MDKLKTASFFFPGATLTLPGGVPDGYPLSYPCFSFDPPSARFGSSVTFMNFPFSPSPLGFVTHLQVLLSAVSSILGLYMPFDAPVSFCYTLPSLFLPPSEMLSAAGVNF